MIKNGFYTIRSISGDHRTFKISTPKLKKDDKITVRFVSLLTGPNNTEDYTSFALLDQKNVIRVFNKHKGTQYEKYANLLNDIFSENSKYLAMGFKVSESLHCMRCNKLLTTIESVALGLGPICSEKGF